MDERLSRYGSAKRYFNQQYQEYLRSTNRLTLFDFEGQALDSILQTAREKLQQDKLAMFERQSLEKANGHKCRADGWFKHIPAHLAHYHKCETDDSSLISYLLQNLQEYDAEGRNVTYAGMSL